MASSRQPMHRGEATPAAVAARSSGGGAGGGAAWAPPYLSGAVDTRGSVISIIPLQATAPADGNYGNGAAGAVEVTVRLLAPPPHPHQQPQHHAAWQHAGVYGGHLPPHSAGQQHEGAEHWVRVAAANPHVALGYFSEQQSPRAAGEQGGGTALASEQQLRSAAQARAASGAATRLTGKGGVAMGPAAVAEPAAPLEETLVWRAGPRESGSAVWGPPSVAAPSPAPATGLGTLRQPSWASQAPGGRAPAAGAAAGFAPPPSAPDHDRSRSRAAPTLAAPEDASWSSSRGPPAAAAAMYGVAPPGDARGAPTVAAERSSSHGRGGVGGGGSGAVRVDLSHGGVLAVLQAQQRARHSHGQKP